MSEVTFNAASPNEEDCVSSSSQLHGVNVLLMGPAGTGKTHALGTLVETGLEVFYLGLEPGLESLLGYFRDSGRDIPPNLHWHQLTSPQAAFSELIDSARKVNTLSLDMLAKLQDPSRSKHDRFIELLTTLNDFKSDRDGKSYGPVNEWDTSRVLAIDGLTGMNSAAMSLVVGGKAVRNQSDWGIAQGQLEKLLYMLTENCPCHFVLLAHVERETDQVLGGIKLMASTLGKALAPKLPSMFSDVILTSREGTKWTWDTASAMADLKTRNLPISQGIKPDFSQIISKWKLRNAPSEDKAGKKD